MANLLSNLSQRAGQALPALLHRRHAEPFVFSDDLAYIDGITVLTISKGRKALVLAQTQTKRFKLLDPFFDACKKYEFPVSEFLFPSDEANEDTIRRAEAAYRENECSAIAAFGDAAIHMAKALAARTSFPPILAVPIKAGSGCEATCLASYRGNERIVELSDPRLIPAAAVFDPALAASVPPHLTAQAGMEALQNALEAYTFRRVPKHARLRAEEAILSIFRNLKGAFDDGTNAEARLAMLHAAYDAGCAAEYANAGAIRSVALALSSRYGTPVGLAEAVFLPVFLELCGKRIEKPLAHLADTVGLPKGTNAEKARCFIGAIRYLNNALGFPEKLDCIAENDIRAIVSAVAGRTPAVRHAPIPFDERTIRKMIDGIR